MLLCITKQKVTTVSDFVIKNFDKHQRVLSSSTSWILVDISTSTIYLLSNNQNIPSIATSNNKILVDVVEFENTDVNDQYYKSTIIEKYTLSTPIKINIVKNNEIYDTDKTNNVSIIAIKNMIVNAIPKQSKLYESIYNSNYTTNDCVALKFDDTYGYLYYKYVDNEIEFNFEPINLKAQKEDKDYKDFTYFFASHGYPKAIKIGESANPDRRYRQICGANPAPISLLFVMPDSKVEKILHKKFDKFLIHGSKEWFYDCPEIREYIEDEKKHADQIINLFYKSIAEKQ